VRDDYVEVKPGTGMLVSARGFGDVQLHIEWRTPTPAQGEGQERGNSGVFLMGIYELQVLDSYQNDTYPDGQAARSTARIRRSSTPRGHPASGRRTTSCFAGRASRPTAHSSARAHDGISQWSADSGQFRVGGAHR